VGAINGHTAPRAKRFAVFQPTTYSFDGANDRDATVKLETEKFISYAQNFEDIRLWRALKFFENGFYIDVGANSPSVDSVTRAFYERGWSGINIDPVQAFYDELCRHRPNDINLQCAAGETEETLTLYDIPGTGLSTLDADIAKGHQESGHEVQSKTVPCRTLASICQEHVQGPIHFLKIDVEGHEEPVLRGMDFTKWRPWILLIEAPFDTHPSWEKIVTDAAYRFVQYDGLNRFYLAEEHSNLAGAFETPPSYLDNFQLCYGHNYSFPIAELERSAAELRCIKQSRTWRVMEKLKSFSLWR
jgi:FkbM family methyltransferase